VLVVAVLMELALYIQWLDLYYKAKRLKVKQQKNTRMWFTIALLNSAGILIGFLIMLNRVCLLTKQQQQQQQQQNNNNNNSSNNNNNNKLNSNTTTK